jgi:ATP-dependent exoDNAse (exonuclease V) alpha subunit
MPNPHFDVQVISRGGGKSAVASASYRSGTKMAARSATAPMVASVVASASYRSGEKLHDARADKTFDYTRKEDVRHKEILAPPDAPAWVTDRETLWNQVEAGEKRKDAQLARDIIAALPRELDTDQQIALVREFVLENFVAEGMIADIAIHEKEASDGGSNPHAHIMLTMREVDAEGFGKKNRDWNRPDRVSAWRASWETLTNHFLEVAGCAERLSLESYAAQGIDQTPQKHMGYEAWHLEEKGVETDKGNENRHIRHHNTLRDVMRGLIGPEAPTGETEEPETARDLKQVSLALLPEPETLSDAPSLRQVGQDLAGSSGATEASGAPVAAWQEAAEQHRAALAQVVATTIHRTPDDSLATGARQEAAHSAAVGGEDAEQQHRATLTRILATTLHRTLQASGELIQRIGLAARAFRERTSQWGQAEYGDGERSGRPLAPPERWTDRILSQRREKEHAHDW